ncbi:MAG TPA: hypothetical protein PK096_01570 [Candidatus Saccharibacteria bacterium]|nr:hypothetical protein [Candidatus Saccharibacteria bacterium]HRK94035.1 hypothetical protein [Candidatus Saccharibacteria bacterium]
MNETLPAVRPEDIEAAEQLAEEATSTTDVATLREMLAEQNGESTVITADDGSQLEVSSIGQEKFAELGKKAEDEAKQNLPVHSETWHTEEK